MKIGYSLFVVFIIACSIQTNITNSYIIKKWEEISTINLPYTPQKSLYSTTLTTLYVFHKETNEIDLYREGKKVNTIGGLGIGNMYFSQLSDIALAPNGTLYTLDSFQREIKRFDENGRFLAKINLIDLSHPILFDVSSDEIFYIYDEDFQAIFEWSDGDTKQSFGKFTSTEPSQLTINREGIFLYEEKTDKTYIFTTFGQFDQEISGYVIRDKGLFIKKDVYFLTTVKNEEKYAFSTIPWQTFMMKQNVICLIAENLVKIGRFHYEAGRKI